MKILQVVPYFPPAYAFGGPAKVAYQMCAELVKRGHDVTVYTTDARDFTSRLDVESAAQLDGIKIYYFKNISMMLVKWSKLFLTPQMLPVAKDKIKTFDIVHLHDYWTLQNVIVHHYSRKYSVPYVLEAHGTLPRATTRGGLKFIYDVFFGYRLLRNASRVIALSPTEAKQYMAKGVRGNRIAIVPNGIDLTEYASLPAKGSFKKKFSIPDEKRIVLYLGRIHKVKGIDFLINAFAYLTERMKYDNAIMVLVGPDDGYTHDAKLLVSSLGLENDVLFTGMLDIKCKTSAYVDSDVVVYPERLNVFGLVPLEAAACSRPVIVSQSNAISNAVSDGKFGFSVKYGDTRGLATLLGNLLSEKRLAEDLGKNGRRYVFENFDLKRIIEKVEQVYQTVVDSASV